MSDSIDVSGDRALLEAAARAVGYKGQWQECANAEPSFVVEYDAPTAHGTTGFHWNPLTSSGDALNLAVTKRFTIKDFAPFDNPEIVQAPADAALWGMVEIWRQDDNDPLHVEWYRAGADRFAATRRAIVRAAASLPA